MWLEEVTFFWILMSISCLLHSFFGEAFSFFFLILFEKLESRRGCIVQCCQVFKCTGKAFKAYLSLWDFHTLLFGSWHFVALQCSPPSSPVVPYPSSELFPSLIGCDICQSTFKDQLSPLDLDSNPVISKCNEWTKRNLKQAATC